MTSGIDLGAAYLAILPDTSKIAPGVRSAFGDAEREAGASGKRSGSSFAAGLARNVKRVTGLGAAIGAGLTVKGGLARLLQIDDARAKLRGMGLEAKGIAKVQASVDAAVTGTAFSMADGMNAATTAMASGVKAGKGLEKYLRLIGDVATQGGAEYNEMASIINQVTARGKVGQENLNRLTERGIGIQSMLADYYGISGDELQTMLRKGQVGVGDFQKVLEENFAGSALKAGDTVRGSFANMRTSVSRLGAAILEPAFAQAPAIFQNITAAVKGLAAEGGPAQRAGQAIGDGLKSLVDAAGSAKDFLGGFTLDVRQVDGEALGSRLAEAVRSGLSKLSGMASDLASVVKGWVSKVDWVGLGIEMGKAAVPLVLGLALGILNVDVGALFSSLADNWQAVLIGALTLIFAPAKLLRPIAKLVNKIPFVGPMLTWFAKSFRKVGRKVLGWVGSLFTKHLWSGFRTGMGWLGPGLAAQFVGMLGRLWPSLKTWGSTFAARFAGAVEYGFHRAGKWIAEGIATLLARMRGFASSLLAFYRGAGTWLLDAGKNLLVGLGRGILSALRFVTAPMRLTARLVVQAGGAIAGFLRRTLGPAFTWLGRNVVTPVVAGIRGTIKRGVDFSLGVFRTFRSGISRIGDAFRSVRGRIASAWEGLKGIIERPLRAGIDVINGFLKAVRRIPGMKKVVPLISWGGTAAAVGAAAKGGQHRGQTGFASGGWTGPGARLKEAGVVHADEFVIRKAARRAFERHNPGLLDHINRTGEMPLHGTYAAGGRVVPGGGNRHTSGYPWATYAGDFPNPIGTPVRAWKDGVIALVRSLTTSYGKHIRMNHSDGTSSLYAHLSSFAAKLGDRVRQGQIIGRVGSTGNSTGPHLHFETMGGPYRGGGGGGGSIWDTLKGAGGRIGEWIKSKLVSKANLGGFFPDASGLFSAIGDGVKKRVLGNLFDSGGLASGIGVLAKGVREPERVLSPRQTRAFEAALSRDFQPGPGPGSGGNGDMFGAFTITNWEEGFGRFEAIAEEAIDRYDAHTR